jgi:hypothetical protein
MKDNIVMIEDTHGHAFLMEIWTPSTATNLKFWHCDRTRYQAGDWEAIHKGFVRFTSGDALLAPRNSSPVVPALCLTGAPGNLADLYLGEAGSAAPVDREALSEFGMVIRDGVFRWGMVLYNFVEEYGKTTGRGVVKHNWVLTLAPGEIFWRQPTQQDFLTTMASSVQNDASAR